MRLMKNLTIPFVFLFMLLLMSMTAAAAEYSSAWYTSGGNWYIKGPNGDIVRNAWVCDNAAGPMSSDNWYLIDSNGVMVTAPLVQDGTGNYYSLETAHNGSYGMLRHVSGTYDGIYLNFNQVHGGNFGAITNPDGIEAMKARYGVYNVSHISNANCVYTSNYKTATQAPSSSSPTTYQINYYANGSKVMHRESSSRNMTVQNYNNSRFLYWTTSGGEIYYPGENYYFSGGASSVRLTAVLESSAPVRTNDYTLAYYYKDCRRYREKTNSSGVFTILSSPGSYLGMPFKYWIDEHGTYWYPGETYYCLTQYDVLQACYDPFTDEYGNYTGNLDDEEGLGDLIEDDYY